jgi:hypothetical protein
MSISTLVIFALSTVKVKAIVSQGTTPSNISNSNSKTPAESNCVPTKSPSEAIRVGISTSSQVGKSPSITL